MEKTKSQKGRVRELLRGGLDGMSRARRLGVAALALLPLWALPGCGAQEEAPEPIRPVLSIVVADTELSGRRFPGRAKATEEVEMAFEVSGQLVERQADVGDVVRAGEVLARLDPRDFQNDLATAKAERDRARAQYSRVEEAARSGAISQQELTDAEARFRQSDAQVAIREKALADSILIAPFAGTIAATYVENFQSVRPKQKVLRLLDTSKIEMIVNIPESLISSVPYVRDIRVRFAPFPDTQVPAIIKEVGNEASRTTRTYPITLLMEQPEEVEILPGMAGEASGRLELPEDAQVSGVEVPIAAVFADDASDSEESYVWVIDPESSSVSRRPVTPLGFSAIGVQVQGVEPGERVVAAGVHSLREGQPVRIQD
jgi:RND family efflux transporter MFP subunit